MDAVLRVDLKARAAAGLDHDLVDGGGAIALRRLGPLGQVDGDGDRRIGKLEMNRLVLLVVGSGEGDVGQPVEGQHAVGLGIGDGLGGGGGLQRRIVGLAVLQREAQPFARQNRVEPHVEATQRDAEVGAEPRPERLDVAHGLQVCRDVAGAHRRRVGLEAVMSAAGADRFEGGLRRGDAGQDRVMAALDARHVHEARRAAQKRAARDDELGYRLPAAFGQCAGAVADALAAFEGAANGRVRLEPLELVVRREIGVLVVEMHDEADRDEVVAVMIEERAAAGAAVERPAEGVLHEPGTVLARRDPPQLLQPDAVLLRVAVALQVEFADQLLGERAARAFGKEGVLAAQLHAAHEILGRLAVASNPHVAGRHAGDRAVFVVEHLGRGKARVDLDAELGRLLGEPGAKGAKAPDVVAVIVHQRRHEKIGKADRAARGQQ